MVFLTHGYGYMTAIRKALIYKCLADAQPLVRGGIAAAACLLLICLGAPLTAPYDPRAVDLALGLQPPTAQHWLGTDQLGRDVLSRVIWAGRISILVTSAVLAITLTLGVVMGLASAYHGGLLDDLLMRFTEFFDGLPQVILALALIGTVGPSVGVLVGALALTGWPRYARFVRSLALRVKRTEYMLAAIVVGAPSRRIMLRHLLPAVLGPSTVQLSLDAGAIVLAIAGLSFLGLGIQPPTPEWGTMLVEARPYLDSAPHLVIPPGAALFILVLGCNLLGEWLDDRLRPSS